MLRLAQLFLASSCRRMQSKNVRERISTAQGLLPTFEYRSCWATWEHPSASARWQTSAYRHGKDNRYLLRAVSTV